MEREKNTAANLQLEILGNYFITGHSFIEEHTPCRAWVFATAKKKQAFYNAEPYKSPCVLSMMPVSQNPLMLEKTMDGIVRKNLCDSLYDANGKFEYYRVAQVWRDILGDESVLSDLEDTTVEDFSTNGDLKRLREINARLLKALSVNPEYVATIRQNIESFLHASKRLAPQFNKSHIDVDYLTSIVHSSEAINRGYQALEFRAPESAHMDSNESLERSQ